VQKKAKSERAQSRRYSFLKILTGSDLSRRRLALMESRSANAGPVVWLTGCVHGDEVGGIVVIQEIFRRLKKEPLLRGRVYAFPLMNPIGFETVSRHIGLSKEDLNRSFPGNPNGSVAERIAERIFTAILQTQPTLVLDLHNDWIKSIPYVLIDPDPGPTHREIYRKAREFSGQTGFVVIGEHRAEANREELKKTLSGSLIAHGIPAISLELGEAYVVNERNVEDGVRSIWNVLAGLEMTAPAELKLNYKMPEILSGRMLTYSHQPVASTSGIIRFLVKPGEIVREGQRVAKIYNVFGKLQETICAQGDAVVLGHSDSSVAMPGVPVVAFGMF
jgi:predicted deacylase